MPPSASARVWAALCGKYPALVELGTIEPEMIIAGSLDAFQRVKPDSVNGIPPTLEQVTRYFQEIGSKCDPQHFLDFYDARGWIVGSSKLRMKDWRAAARLWARNAPVIGKVNTVQGTASLFALQAQLTTVEREMNEILYPAGSAFKVIPQGAKRERFNVLTDQRHVLKGKIDAFAIG